MLANRAVTWSALALLAACGGGPTGAEPAPGPPPRAAPAAPARASERPRAERVLLWAWLRDARGLSVGAAVKIAGLPSGRIAAIRRGPHGTRIDITVPEDHPVWTSARLWKRPTHREGEFYLELDPGDGPADAERADRFAPRRLADGDEIADVIEDPSAQDLMDHIDRTLPHR